MLGPETPLKKLSLTYVSMTSNVANEFIDLIASLDANFQGGEGTGLEELTLKKFPKTLELESDALTKLASRCKGLRKLTVWGMQEMSESSRLCLS